jgi:beta-glucosidase
MRVEDLLARMTLDEKIGQMIQIEHPYIAPSDVSQYFMGSVLSGGNGLSDNSPDAWRELVESYLAAALDTRLAIPLLYGVDATHGHAHILGATIFPQAIGLGATRDPALVEKIARATAEEMVATSIRINGLDRRHIVGKDRHDIVIAPNIAAGPKMSKHLTSRPFAGFRCGMQLGW